MHHRPSGPPLSRRVAGALTRWSLLLGAAMHRTLPARLGRFAFGALVTTTVVGLVLAIPVISGVGAPAVQLDSSSTTSPSRDGNSPVVMGMDGRPVSSDDFAGVTTSGPAPSSAVPTSSSETSVEAAPAQPDVAASESVDAPAPGTIAEAPAEAPSAGGTTSGSSSPAAPVQPTPPGPDPAPAPPPTAPTESPIEVADPVAEVLGLVNGERAALGCGALVADAGLAATAQAHSAAMSGSGLLDLDGLVGAVAQGADATSVVGGWFADSSAAPLLDCARTSAGIAVVDGWWTALVA